MNLNGFKNPLSSVTANHVKHDEHNTSELLEYLEKKQKKEVDGQ